MPIINGNDLDNLLVGTANDDEINGFGGNDTLIGGAGSDSLSGGPGADRAHYSTDPAAITVTFTGATSATVLDGYGGTDTLTDIEFVLGSQINDTFTGSVGSRNVFIGLRGNDIFNGNGGDGGVHDVVDYSFDVLFGATHGIVVNQHGGISQGGLPPDTAIDSFGDTDSLPNVPDIIGTQFHDEIWGGAHDNVLSGLAGDDFIFGNDGNDELNGGDNNDTLDGGNDNDTLIGGAGADSLTGGAGIDTASYATATTGVTADLANPANNTGDALGDSYNTIENLTGSNFNDLLRGNGGNNRLTGGGGNDSLNGRGGADVLDGGTGGADIADYRNVTTSITVNLADPIQNTGEAAGDTFISIEGIRGGSANDTLTGDDNDTVLIGGAGADTLNGGNGQDTADYRSFATGLTANLSDPSQNTGDAAGDIYISIERLRGGDGNDTLIGDGGVNQLEGGAGADVLDGRDGLDFARYFAADGAITASLANQAINTGDAAGDTYTSIEGLIGSNFDDTLIGDSNDNQLDGNAGADVLNGGAGFDFARYQTASSNIFGDAADTGVLANLSDPSQNTGDAAGDTYISIEGLIGSNLNDTLIGDGNNNFLRGAVGADVLDGRGGFDVADYLRIGAAESGTVTSGVTADLSNSANNTGDAAGDIYTSIEGLRGSVFADVLTGNDGVNTLEGRGGDDTLDGKLGDDTAIFLGNRSDYVVSGAPGAMTIVDTVAGRDGTDIVNNVEFLRFADGTFAATDFFAGSVSIADVTISEGDAGTKLATFTLTRLGGTAAFDVSFSTANGSATAGSDYLAASGTVSFAVGQNTAQVTVTINGDTTVEPDETFLVNLSGATNGAIISDAQAQGTITNDDGSVIVGQPGQTTVNGTAGSDHFVIGATNVVVNGGAGDDTTTIAPGSLFQAHLLNGGTGADTLDLSQLNTASNVNLALGIASGSQIGLSVLTSIENVIGGAGNDSFTASNAVNVLTGGAGSDSFSFATLDAARNGATFSSGMRDVVTDFRETALVPAGAPHDTINLAAIDAIQGGANNAFTFNPTAWNGVGAEFTAAGQLRYQYVTDQNGVEHTIIAGNVNAPGQGNGLAADFEIDLVGRHTLSASDFVL
jgi:Ca2+-binding RTX toxin-like protein